MPKRPPPIPKLMPPKAPSKTVAPAKTFKVEPWTGENEGEKIVGYGDTGMGKTTLFSMLPSPIFIGLDDGGRRIVNPKTGDAIQHIPDIKTYQDVRDVLHQVDLFPAGSSCVIDTITLLRDSGFWDVDPSGKRIYAAYRDGLVDGLGHRQAEPLIGTEEEAAQLPIAKQAAQIMAFVQQLQANAGGGQGEPPGGNAPGGDTGGGGMPPEMAGVTGGVGQ